jgi:hypothetical protein
MPRVRLLLRLQRWALGSEDNVLSIGYDQRHQRFHFPVTFDGRSDFQAIPDRGFAPSVGPGGVITTCHHLTGPHTRPSPNPDPV